MSRPHEESEAEVKAAAGAWDPGHHTADTPEPPAEEGSSGDLSSLAGSFAAQAALRERQQGAKGAEGSRGAPFLPARPPAGGAGEERAAAGAPPPGSPLHPGVGPEAKASEAKSQVPGEPVDLGLKALDMGRDLLQSFAPVKAVHEHVCAWHYYAHDQTRQVEAHHYCSHPSAEVRQCLLFDSDQPGARLIGLEYIISERLFKELPEEEKRYWHSHRYEVGSGLLVAPRVPGIAERQDMQRLIGTYGKAWHTWQVDRGDPLPYGPPQLMGAFTADGQIRPGLVAQRDARYGISTAEKGRERREKLEWPADVDPAADSWLKGAAWQTTMQDATFKPAAPGGWSGWGGEVQAEGAEGTAGGTGQQQQEQEQ